MNRRSILGVVVPDSAAVDTTAASDVASIGGAVVQLAAEAHRKVLAAAAVLAARQAAHATVEAELQATVRRLRAIEHRWLPAHTAELRKLELALDEAEFADIARARWAAQRPR